MRGDQTFNNEEDILQHLSLGDEKAFRQLYEIHWNRVYTMALLYLKSPFAAQDIVQEVFLKIWLKRQELNLIDNFSAFLHTMTRNLIISGLRKKAPAYGLEQMDENALPVSNLSPEQALAEDEIEKIILQAIDQLTPRQQQVYLMSRETGLSLKEVALQLHISYDTAREHMSLALKSIRAYLAKHLDVFFLLLLFI
jgi:RNA polymerase sigma-70 factor (family 1)